jgi:hypothetical protein
MREMRLWIPDGLGAAAASADLRGIKGRGDSTIRGYQNGLRLFHQW